MNPDMQRTPTIADSLRAGIEDAAKCYPTRRSAIMPALYLAQARYGTLTGDVIASVAQVLEVPEIWAFEAATFYSLYHTGPVGRFHIQLCTNVSCLLTGAASVQAWFEETLGIHPGETTSDGLFTLSTVECLGGCDRAPVLMVNDIYHNTVTPMGASVLVDALKKEAGA